MLCYISNSHSAPFNLATEEFFLKNYTEDIFMLYRNYPSLIVGKHQNTLAEINLDVVESQNIPVIRRLSGGGAVFHDMGNINFCFIVRGEKGSLVNFRKYTQPILEVLLKLGIHAQFEGRNDLTIHGLKISGNASHVYKDKVIQHGTLLFSSNLSQLNKLLKVNPLKFKDKAIRSIRSKVTNISEHLPRPISIEEFSREIMSHILNSNPQNHTYELPETHIEAIENLVNSKYDTWQWNYGYSPRYSLEKLIHNSTNQWILINLEVEKGRIVNIKLSGNGVKESTIDTFANNLMDCPHSRSNIKQKLDSLDLNHYFKHIDSEGLIMAFF